MASSSLARTLVTFSGRVQRSKNRIVAVPAEAQRTLGLKRRPHNHLIHVSIRRAGQGRWNHHYLKLTADNEMAIPADVTGIAPGDPVEVKVHGVIADEVVEREIAGTGGSLLLEIAGLGPGERPDGARRPDDYINAGITA